MREKEQKNTKSRHSLFLFASYIFQERDKDVQDHVRRKRELRARVEKTNNNNNNNKREKRQRRCECKKRESVRVFQTILVENTAIFSVGIGAIISTRTTAGASSATAIVTATIST
jgi:hypothetical protein